MNVQYIWKKFYLMLIPVFNLERWFTIFIIRRLSLSNSPVTMKPKYKRNWSPSPTHQPRQTYQRLRYASIQPKPTRFNIIFHLWLSVKLILETFINSYLNFPSLYMVEHCWFSLEKDSLNSGSISIMLGGKFFLLIRLNFILAAEDQ